jgi:hypothetical protein
VVARRAFLTTSAATLSLGAAAVALAVPVVSGGIDPATGVVLLLVLAAPCGLYVLRLNRLRLGLPGSARRVAIAAIILCSIWALGMVLAHALTQPFAIDCFSGPCDSRTPDQRATSDAFLSSAAFYAVSGLVGLGAIFADTGLSSHRDRGLSTAIPTAVGILAVVLCVRILHAAGPDPNLTEANFDTVLTEAGGNLYGASYATLEELSPTSAILARTTVHVPSGYTDASDTLTVDTHRHVIVFAAKNDPNDPVPFPPEKVIVYSWPGQVLHAVDLKRSVSCGTSGAPFTQPVTLGADSHDAIYMTCSGQVLKLSPGLARIEHWGNYAFGYATGLAMDGDDDLYVLDYRGTRVIKLSPAGHVLARWGLHWPHPQEQDPSDRILAAPSDRVVVGNSEGDYQAFSATGRPLGPWRSAGTARPGWDFLAIDEGDTLYASDGTSYWKVYPNGQKRPWRGLPL